MKTTNISILGILLFIPFLSFSAPYTVIHGQPFVKDGCMYFRISIHDDNGTPHDTSDDTVIVASESMNTCDDAPSGIDPNHGGNTTTDYHAIIYEQQEMNLEDGTTLIVYSVRIIRTEDNGFMAEEGIPEDME